jgi:hypothetical protein
VLDESRRPYAVKEGEEIRVEMRTGDAAEFVRVWDIAREFPLPPGPVTVRVASSLGPAMEETLELREGERRTLPIVLPRR